MLEMDWHKVLKNSVWGGFLLFAVVFWVFDGKPVNAENNTLELHDVHCIGHGCEILNKPPGTYCQYFTPDKIVAVSPKEKCDSHGLKVTITK